MSKPPALPLIEPGATERADAARNRERILCTARRLFTERGAACVSMDEIADAAGVGKGTLFRRFGSRAALALAVLSEGERDFQEAIIRGEPPLGPGAPPAERLIAFGWRRLDLLAENAELLAAGEVGPARFTSAPYGVYRLHMVLLLREADPGCDAEYLAELLLAALGAEIYTHLHEAREMPMERLKEGWAALVERVLAPAARPAGEANSALPAG
jgi:AcrR family transcriptional regulator